MTTITDHEIRLRCLDVAVRNPGNPNIVQQAREFYAFATEKPQGGAGATQAPPQIATDAEAVVNETVPNAVVSTKAQPQRNARK